MNPIDWLAFLALIVASYLATIHLSLIDLSHSSFRRRLSERGKAEQGQWFLDRIQPCILTTSLLRTASRLTFFGLVLVDIIGVGAPLTVSSLVTSGVIAMLALWLCSSVLAAAIASHAGTGVLVHSLPLLRLFALLGLPLLRGVAFLDEIVRRLSGANLPDQDQVEAELLRSIEDSHIQGGLDAGAAELLENVVEFRSTDVGEVMTPRTDIYGLEMTDDLEQIRKFIIEVGHSRIPVYRENMDHIEGILYVKDLMPYLGEHAPDFTLQPLLRQPIRVPETKIVHELLADFQKSEVHMALVIDEYGGTAGLVTIEDVLEELVGEIKDEHDTETEEPPTMALIDEYHAEVDGRYHLDDLNEQLHLGLPEEDEFDTVGGFFMAQFGRVPQTGDSFESHNARFTALVASPTHVQKVGIELLTPLRANGEVLANGTQEKADG